MQLTVHLWFPEVPPAMNEREGMRNKIVHCKVLKIITNCTIKMPDTLSDQHMLHSVEAVYPSLIIRLFVLDYNFIYPCVL